MKRRTFIRNTGLTAASFAIASGSAFAVAESKVKIGLIGTGLRGQSHLELLLKRNDVDVVAICDIDDFMLGSAKKLIDASKKKMPQVYTGGIYAWKDMLSKTQLDAVIIATPWEWHNPMVLGAIDAGIKYVGCEVIMGITLEDHWNLVHAKIHDWQPRIA